MKQTTLDKLVHGLTHQLHSERDRWRLGSAEIEVDPVLNFGGFAKSSFRVASGAGLLHIKLAPANEQGELRRWMAVHEHLTAHYRAPVVRGWIDVACGEYGGLVFEHLHGRAWRPGEQPDLTPAVARLLDQLHHDQELAERLGD